MGTGDRVAARHDASLADGAVDPRHSASQLPRIGLPGGTEHNEVACSDGDQTIRPDVVAGAPTAQHGDELPGMVVERHGTGAGRRLQGPRRRNFHSAVRARWNRRRRYPRVPGCRSCQRSPRRSEAARVAGWQRSEAETACHVLWLARPRVARIIKHGMKLHQPSPSAPTLRLRSLRECTLS